MNDAKVVERDDAVRRLMKRRDGILKFNCVCESPVAFGVKEQQTGTMRGKRVVCPDCCRLWLLTFDRANGFWVAFLL
jgi:hypothetical protein